MKFLEKSQHFGPVFEKSIHRRLRHRGHDRRRKNTEKLRQRKSKSNRNVQQKLYRTVTNNSKTCPTYYTAALPNSPHRRMVHHSDTHSHTHNDMFYQTKILRDRRNISHTKPTMNDFKSTPKHIASKHHIGPGFSLNVVNDRISMLHLIRQYCDYMSLSKLSTSSQDKTKNTEEKRAVSWETFHQWNNCESDPMTVVELQGFVSSIKEEIDTRVQPFVSFINERSDNVSYGQTFVSDNDKLTGDRTREEFPDSVMEGFAECMYNYHMYPVGSVTPHASDTDKNNNDLNRLSAVTLTNQVEHMSERYQFMKDDFEDVWNSCEHNQPSKAGGGTLDELKKALFSLL